MPRLFQSFLPRTESGLAATGSVRMPPAPPPLDDDLALGWECAAPALQIDCWAREAHEDSVSVT